MKYEPKVGDEVVLRGDIVDIRKDDRWVNVELDGMPHPYLWWVPPEVVFPARDLGEAELRGQVSGPWAVELSEALTKAEARIIALEAADSLWVKTFQDRFAETRARIEALEASARVRDVPATMVNLAHRVQTLEGTVKTMLEEMRERTRQLEHDRDALIRAAAAPRAELDGVLVRLGRLESARADVEDPINVKWTADTGQFMFFPRGRDPNRETAYNMYKWTTGVASVENHIPPIRNLSTRPRDHQHGFGDADEVRDAQGRVLKSKIHDVDPQGDWNTARTANGPTENIDRDALETVLWTNQELRERLAAAQKAREQIRSANQNLMADLQRAEARLDALDDALRLADAERVPNMDEYHRGWYSCVEMARAALSAGRKDPAHGAHAQASE